MSTRNDLIDAYRKIGLTSGDTLVVQSSFKGLGGFEGTPEDVVKALLEVVGQNGTLVMPAYHFTSWTEDHYYDSRETPSKMGVITETFRLMPGIRRTKHPIHSLAAYGKHADVLCSIDAKDSFGADSVFATLLELNAMYSTLGTGLDMPFLPCHYPETVMNVEYRRLKMFSGIYIDENGKPELKSYGFKVKKDSRKAPIYQTHILQFERGHIKKAPSEKINLVYGRAKNYNDSLISMIHEFPELFR